MELVHHHGRDLGEVERFGVQQPIEEDLGHDDEHLGVGVFASIAGDQSDVGRIEPPADGLRLHFAKLLFGERDQRRRIVGRSAGVQSLEHRRLGDQRFSHAGGRTHEHALVGLEPRQQGIFLEGIRIEAELIDIAFRQIVA